MNVQTFLNKVRNTTGNQRGVTLMELILVIALMTLVFGGIVSLLTSMYTSYEQTSTLSENEREATMIINQLAQDIRKSVEDVEADRDPVVIDPQTGSVTIQTVKQDHARSEAVEYRNENGKIFYHSEQNAEIELSQSGRVTVDPDEQEPKKRYQLTVVVGSGAEQAKKTTEVARYDWSENMDQESDNNTPEQ